MSDALSDTSDIIDRSYVNFLFEECDYDQDKPLYIDPDNPERNLSSRQIRTMVSQVVAGLRHFGLKKGDPVCVMALNDIYYTPLYLGIMAAGGIYTGINPGSTVFEVKHHLRLCKVQFLIASPAALNVARKAADMIVLPPGHLFIFDARYSDTSFDCKSWWRLLEHGEGEWEPIADPMNEPACYISSSGTSGLPKAVVVPHKYLENQVTGLVNRDLPYEVSRLICIPPFVGYNVPSQHGAPIKTGQTIYVQPRYEIKAFLAAVKKFKVTETLLLPPIILNLPSNPYVQADPKVLMSLRQIFCGGAAIGSGVQSRMYTILHPDARIAQIYGMTEVGWTCGSLYPEKDETGSVGTPLKTYEIKIVDDNEVEIAEPEIQGEIFIKAQYPMLGYLKNEAANMAAFAPNGWIRTGDVGKLGTNGLYYITDRKKDLIKTRGWQVSPAEVEEVMLMHPKVLDAAVIGAKVPGPSTEEFAQAYIVLKKGATLTTEEVKAWARKHLAAYKVPQDVFFLETLPRNPTGKIIRRLIRPQYLEWTRRKSEYNIVGMRPRETTPTTPASPAVEALQTPFISPTTMEAGNSGQVRSQLLTTSTENKTLVPRRMSIIAKVVRFLSGGTSDDDKVGVDGCADKENAGQAVT